MKSMYAYSNDIVGNRHATQTDLLTPLYQQRKISAIKKRQEKITVVSLFSGCGGMDLGFVGGFEFLGKTYNPLPFDIIWANELNQNACATYDHNIGEHIVCGDIWQVMERLPESADVVIGSVHRNALPC